MSGSVTHSIEAQRYTQDRNVYATSVESSTSDESSAVSIRSSSDYTVSISEEAQALLDDDKANAGDQNEKSSADAVDKSTSTDADSSNELSEDEQNKVAELKSRDQEVRTHEQAHASAGGQYAGSPSYDYEQGPDGKRYAVGGEVQIDVSPIPNNAQATIDKMKQVYRAALAPSEPSAADRAVAREAQANITEASSQLLKENSLLSENSTAPSSTSRDGSVLSDTALNQTDSGSLSRRPLSLTA
ncbi:catalase [Marinomonas piezotolerans]|uniref:Catalase n=1 Tax=Marinomonas piezotolerans TaxID=2213058 RepID=A0A370UEB6_9GAMM|nr:putative metalloprotease CJM1_0395 family protein [Marinomonas piezotolerans]RDL46091.1 catalase [Marinomonas piezotolerans]